MKVQEAILRLIEMRILASGSDDRWRGREWRAYAEAYNAFLTQRKAK